MEPLAGNQRIELLRVDINPESCSPREKHPERGMGVGLSMRVGRDVLLFEVILLKLYHYMYGVSGKDPGRWM